MHAPELDMPPDPESYACRTCGQSCVLNVNEDRCPSCGTGIDGDPRREAAPTCRCGHAASTHADNGIGRCRWRLSGAACADDCVAYDSTKQEVWRVQLEVRLDPRANYLPLFEWDWQTLLDMKEVRAVLIDKVR